MKKLLLLLAFSLLYALPSWSQGYTNGSITAVDTSATCSTSGGFVSVNVLQNSSSVAFTVSGTFSATLQFVGTVDGTSWVAVNAFPPNSTTAVTSTTSGGTWKADVANFSQFCVRASAYVSGAATVGMRNSSGVSTSTLTGGGGGGLAPNSPGIPQANGATFYAINYGVKADTFAVYDAVCSNGSNLVTSATAHFQTADPVRGTKIRVGERIWAIPGAGTSSSTPSIDITTVLSIDSDSQIHTTANGNSNCGSTQALIWGDDDTAALNTLWTAVNASQNCGAIYLPAGMMAIKGTVMSAALSTVCASELINNSVTINSTGWQTSTFVPAPDFDWTTCPAASCIGVPGIQYNNVQLNGFGLSHTDTPAASSKTLFSFNTPAATFQFSCQGFSQADNNVVGVSVPAVGIEWMIDPQIAGCGGNGPNFGAVGPVIGGYIVPGNGASPVISTAGPNGTDFFNNWFGGSGSNECGLNISGFANMFGMPTKPGAEVCVPAGHLRATGGSFSHSQGIANRAALKITSAGFASATNENFADAGAGEFAVSVDATSTFEDGCGNTYTGNINVTAGGIFIPCFLQIYPSDTNKPTATGTGACATGSLGTQHGTMYYGTIVCGTTTGASSLTLAPGTTATNGFLCFAWDRTTTANILASGAVSTANCPFSGTVNNGDTIQYLIIPF